MNILYIDIDSLRPDHLGCYGYHRDTSPNIDAIAREGMRFSNCYAPDAPCLPSRTAITTGRFGIHTGVVNHGGVASQPHIWGADRHFGCSMTEQNWVERFRQHDYHTVAFSPFAQRHGAWHWYAGFMEMHNTGGSGQETADVISPQVTEWFDRHKAKGSNQPFFMWVNVWDPHTPYRTPLDYGEPFADEPIPDWYTEDVHQAHWKKPGAHSPQEVLGYSADNPWIKKMVDDDPPVRARQPKVIDSMEAARKMFDGYDAGVSYADMHVGRIIQSLKDNGMYEDTAIIISADHGENLGELWVYGDHQTADQFTCNIPMVVRWPGITDKHAGEVDDRLMYSLDMAASTLEFAGINVPDNWDGQSFAGDFMPEATCTARDHVVLSQMAWCAQRSVRWEDYLYIETYHDAFRDYPEQMLFNLKDDPHEQHDLAPSDPALTAKGKAMLEQWHSEQMATATHKVDPLETVMAEGGPYHAQGVYEEYLERLKATERGEAAESLAKKHGAG